MKIYKFAKENLPLLQEPPFVNEEDKALVHIGECEGYMYISVKDDYTPNEEVEASLVSADEIAEVKTRLYAYLNINNEISAKIRERYSIDAEFKAIRTNDADYRAFVDAVVAEGKAKKAALGF